MADEHACFFCPVCGSYFNKDVPHNLSGAITMSPPAGQAFLAVRVVRFEKNKPVVAVTPATPDQLAAILKRPFGAAMHESCYPTSICHEAEFTGQWPDAKTYLRVAVDSINNVPIFFTKTEPQPILPAIAEAR